MYFGTEKKATEWNITICKLFLLIKSNSTEEKQLANKFCETTNNIYLKGFCEKKKVKLKELYPVK